MIKKLKQKKGASLLIALVLFIIAAMVAVVVVDASLTMARRIDDEKRVQQDYLAVTSAGQMFESVIKTLQIRWVETEEIRNGTTRTTKTSKKISINGVEWADTKSPSKPEEAFASALKKAFLTATEKSGSDRIKVGTFTVDGGSLGVEPVTAEIYLYRDQTAGGTTPASRYANGWKSYLIEGIFSTQDGNGQLMKLSAECKMTDTVKTTSIGEEESDDVRIKTIHKLSWKDGISLTTYAAGGLAKEQEKNK